MVDKKEKQTCSGCSACEAICPKRCIRMEKDDQSFYYPVVDHEACIECGLCDKVCENTTAKKNTIEVPRSFGAYTTNKVLRMESSSGGVFSLFAEKILDSKGVVISAAMSSDCYFVEHITVSEKKELDSLRGSKYVQSRMGQKYNEIKSLLEEGQKVLFTGTPCQVNGLRAYLKKDYDNLFCLDFICHGVPSEKVWEKYCKEAEKLLGNKVTSVNFRNKKYSWERFGISFESNGKGKIFRSKAEDPYLRLFQKNYGLRPSCYQCQHKGIVRNSDITIGDFWGIRRVIPGFSDGCGVSLLLIHSPKGLRMFDEIRNDIVAEEVNTIKAVDNNVAALESVYQPYDNNTFWDNVNAMTVGKVADRFAPISKKEKIKIVAVKSPLYKVIKKHRKNAK